MDVVDPDDCVCTHGAEPLHRLVLTIRGIGDRRRVGATELDLVASCPSFRASCSIGWDVDGGSVALDSWGF